MDVVNQIQKSIENLVAKYAQEQERKLKNNNIILGRIFSVGQYYPFILAEQLFSDKKDYLVFVDHHIKIDSKNLYPDILVINKNIKRAIAIIEVKLDLGWFNTTDAVDGLIKNYNLRGSQQVVVKFNGLNDKFTFDKELKKLFFIVTIANDHNRFPEVKRRFTDAGFQVVHCLEKHHHPNNKTLSRAVIEADIKLNANSLLAAFSWLK